jgi:hypothetical protein
MYGIYLLNVVTQRRPRKEWGGEFRQDGHIKGIDKEIRQHD